MTVKLGDFASKLTANMRQNQDVPSLTTEVIIADPKRMNSAEMKSVASELAKTFSVMASRNRNEHDAKSVISIYVSDLSDLPAESVIEAISDFRRGEAGYGTWAPTVGEIRKHIEYKNIMKSISQREQDSGGSQRIKSFRIDRDSKQGRAWEAYGRDVLGRGYPWPNSRWYFETEWPPGNGHSGVDNAKHHEAAE